VWTGPLSFKKVRSAPLHSFSYLTEIARLFNSSPIQPRRCRVLLTKIALLLYTGEKFPTNEATTLFFGISKLFQNKDASLRQMVHLIIKELAHSAEDIIMVTSTIMKDTGGGTDAIYRPNAIRALCRIIDVGCHGTSGECH
jgi:coatomer subunit gamma